MCGACGTGRVAPAWEELLAGAGPAERAARARAAGRLLADRRMRVSPWRGGFLVASPTGAARPVACLDQLWAAAGDPAPAGAPGAGAHWAWASSPASWDVQAVVVWISAAAHAGSVAEAVLPLGIPAAVRFPPSGGPELLSAAGNRAGVGLLGPDAGRSLATLLDFARSDPSAAS
jgi:hypothetical protein